MFAFYWGKFFLEINEAQVWRQNIYIYVIYIKERSVRGGRVENKTGRGRAALYVF